MQQNMDTFISIRKNEIGVSSLSHRNDPARLPSAPAFIGGKRNKCHQACRLSLVGFGWS